MNGNNFNYNIQLACDLECELPKSAIPIINGERTLSSFNLKDYLPYDDDDVMN